ncbi:hypothetical protein E2562_028223 [Oryza meyeriana var. granulata]|uniref:Uncharacterized protein n=1 Tax=Oryza meyeriana var. granulata TaxID=110450 RepID=A0A6G1DRQ0_9ORYZ|nr:hypothetical protein E2562_028223 [Oryza meyeriana var. granulata]
MVRGFLRHHLANGVAGLGVWSATPCLPSIASVSARLLSPPHPTEGTRVVAINNAWRSFQEEDNIAYNTEPTIMEDDQNSISSGDTDHEQEKTCYVEKLKEMKRQREDPMNHCEGDIDIEDLYAPEDDVVDLGTADVDALIGMACELFDPPSEDGRLSALESETDEESKPPPGKRRRRKGVQVQRIYFDESNMTEISQLCKGMCFTKQDNLGRL